MKVEITMEKTIRIAKVFDVTEEQLDDLIRGENPFFDELEEEIETGDIEYDYAVNDIDGNEIIPWE